MAASPASDTPEARLQSLFGKFDAGEQALIGSIRSALRQRLPAANELVYDYGTFFVIAYSATEQPTQGIVSLAARPDGVRLYFMNGPGLPDPRRLLQGKGKQARFLVLDSAARVAHPEVEALIAAAIGHAAAPLPPGGRGSLFIRTFGGKQVPRPKPAKQ
jgi:hypothetical protein